MTSNRRIVLSDEKSRYDETRSGRKNTSTPMNPPRNGPTGSGEANHHNAHGARVPRYRGETCDHLERSRLHHPDSGGRERPPPVVAPLPHLASRWAAGICLLQPDMHTNDLRLGSSRTQPDPEPNGRTGLGTSGKVVQRNKGRMGRLGDRKPSERDHEGVNRPGWLRHHRAPSVTFPQFWPCPRIRRSPGNRGPHRLVAHMVVFLAVPTLLVIPGAAVSLDSSCSADSSSAGFS